jgi:hypothetical protein
MLSDPQLPENTGAAKSGIITDRTARSDRNSRGQFLPGNPGRRKGAKSKKRYLEELAKYSDLTPFEFLCKCMNNEELDTSLRISAASALLCYTQSKMPTAARKISETLSIPVPTNASEAASAIARVTSAMGAGKIRVEDAAELIKGFESYSRVYAGADLEAVVQRVREELSENGAFMPRPEREPLESQPN